MPLVIDDRVRETTTVTGTNDAVLLGAVTGFQAFSAIGNGNTTYYTISDQSGGNWEVGLGTYSSVGPTLARTTVLSSSAGGAKVSFPAGTKDVFVTYPADKAVYLDASNNITPATGTPTVTSLTDSGNLTFTGTGNRITGDFSNATIANRVMFQSSTTNGATSVEAIPNGTSTTSAFISENSATTDNSFTSLQTSATASAIVSGIRGTGTYLPLTMFTGGSERLRIDTSGNVGIGTASPASKLAVSGATDIFQLYSSTSGAYQRLFSTGTTASPYLGAEGNNFVLGSWGVGERMRIDTSGNVGIGTSNPATKLQIAGDATNVLPTTWGQLRITGATNANQLLMIGYDTTNDYGFIQATKVGTAYQNLVIQSGGGNVGIGTSSPQTKLQIVSGADGAQATFTGAQSTTEQTLLFRNAYYTNNTTAGVAAIGWIDSGSSGGNLTFKTGVNGGGTTNIPTEKMRIDSSGNIGVGTTSIGYRLEVVTNSNALAGQRIYNTNAGSGAGTILWFGNDTSSTNSAIFLNSSTNTANGGANSLNIYQAFAAPIAFHTTNTERMRIDSSGNVLIGKTSAYRGSKLVVSASNVSQTSGNANFHVTTTDTQAANVGGSIGLGGQIGTDEAPFGYISGRKENSTSGNYAGYLAFATMDASITIAERMRIDSSGNVGIGTTPVAKLDVLGTINAKSATAAVIQLYSTNAADQSNTIGSYYNSGAGFSQLNHSASFYTWGTSGTERMRIDSSGNLLVGKNAVGYADGMTTYASGQIDVARSLSGTATTMVNFNNSATSATIGSITSTTSATSYNTSSDYRLKENIAPMIGALDTVAQLKPVTYTWKTDGSNGQGFIAHELQAVVPDCVTGEKDAVDEEGNPKYQGIDVSFLVATLTAAIKEQQVMIEELKAKVAALEAN